MSRQTIILVALLAALCVAAIYFCPTQDDRPRLAVRILVRAGELPLPQWLEDQRVEWICRIGSW